MVYKSDMRRDTDTMGYTSANGMCVCKFAIVMPWHISEAGGGAEVQAWFLAKELAKRGLEVHYVCQSQWRARADSQQCLENVQVHWLGASRWFPWMSGKKYYRALASIRPDVVVQRMSSEATYVIGKYCKKHGAEFAWICTGNAASRKKIHTAKVRNKLSLREVGLCRFTYAYTNAFVCDLLRDIGMKHVTLAYTQNSDQEKCLFRNFGLSSHRIVSGHPLPTTVRPIGERFHRRQILWAANLGSHKRPDLFLELARLMEHTPCHFTLIGGHSNRDYVDTLFTNAPPNLTYHGKVPFDEANAFFDRAALFVNTSSGTGDGFPNTYVQALLRGVPVVSLGFDPDDIIVRHQLGFVSHDLGQVARFIGRILDSEDEYRALASRCKAFAAQRLTIDKMVESFLAPLPNTTS